MTVVPAPGSRLRYSGLAPHPAPRPEVARVRRRGAAALDASSAPISESDEPGTVQALEAERRRIARDLHDVVGQALVAVRTCLATTKRLSREPALAVELGDAITTVELALEEMRTFAVSLRSPVLDDLGLIAALRWQVVREAERFGLVATLVTERVPALLPPDVETACFRVVQEALSNVARHARAKSVSVRIGARDGILNLRIRDDGMGFDPRIVPAGDNGTQLGILGMHERAALVGGALRIVSGAGGTTIWLRIPLSATRGR
jgi:signal transduction histidine kinase